jgi:hypothetical protein
MLILERHALGEGIRPSTQLRARRETRILLLMVEPAPSLRPPTLHSQLGHSIIDGPLCTRMNALKS